MRPSNESNIQSSVLYCTEGSKNMPPYKKGSVAVGLSFPIPILLGGFKEFSRF